MCCFCKKLTRVWWTKLPRGQIFIGLLLQAKSTALSWSPKRPWRGFAAMRNFFHFGLITLCILTIMRGKFSVWRIKWEQPSDSRINFIPTNRSLFLHIRKKQTCAQYRKRSHPTLKTKILLSESTKSNNNEELAHPHPHHHLHLHPRPRLGSAISTKKFRSWVRYINPKNKPIKVIH